MDNNSSWPVGCMLIMGSRHDTSSKVHYRDILGSTIQVILDKHVFYITNIAESAQNNCGLLIPFIAVQLNPMHCKVLSRCSLSRRGRKGE